ncbi:MAG: hypothetical protein AVDCRST_MAG68-1343, partial [uncultured Gemmatimonadetes bacterium]
CLPSARSTINVVPSASRWQPHDKRDPRRPRGAPHIAASSSPSLWDNTSAAGRACAAGRRAAERTSWSSSAPSRTSPPHHAPPHPKIEGKRTYSPTARAN